MVSAAVAKANQDRAAAKFRAAVGETVFRVQQISSAIARSRVSFLSTARNRAAVPALLEELAGLVKSMTFNDFQKLQVRIPEVTNFFTKGIPIPIPQPAPPPPEPKLEFDFPPEDFPMFVNGFRDGVLVFASKVRNLNELNSLKEVKKLDRIEIVKEEDLERDEIITDETVLPAVPVNPFFRDKNGEKVFLKDLPSLAQRQIKSLIIVSGSSKT